MTTANKIDIGPPPHPTDRERELALEVGRAFDSESGRAALLTTVARCLARYRVELDGRHARDAAYALVEADLRDRRVDTVTLNASVVCASRRGDGDPVMQERVPSHSLLSAVNGLGVPA